MRFIGMDVHRDWCEVAVAEGGELRSGERVKAEPEALELFAQSLAPDDQVVLEATFGAARIAEIIEPHVARVVVCDPRRLAKADSRKTDRRDARKLAQLLASGFLDEVWTPDEQTRSLRRLVARRASIVRARTRAKNEVHAALGRNLCPRPPMKDLFGRAGRRWLAGVELPEEEQITVDGCLRQIDFSGTELAEIDRVLAQRALASPEARRLMTVPGVNVQTAIGFLASVGDVGRFSSPKKLVAYLGLDPRVRQSGESAARHGRISKAGRASARHVLSESAWSVAMTPGPMKAFFERLRARRGAQVAAVDDPPEAAGARAGDRRPSAAWAPTRRRPASQPRHSGRRAPGLRAGRGRLSPPDRQLAAEAEERRAPARHGSAHLVGRQAARQRGRDQPQNLRFSSSSGPAPATNSRK